MEDKVLNRIKELTEQIEVDLKDREKRLGEIRDLEFKIKAMSNAVLELKQLLEPAEEEVAEDAEEVKES